MKPAETYKIANLIAGKILGICSVEEEAALNNWILESNEHRILFERISERGVQNYIPADLSAVKREIRAGIDRKVYQKRIATRRIIGWSAVAAAVLIMAALPFTFKRAGNGDENLLSTIYPTGYAAELILEDGSRIVLDGKSEALGREDLTIDVVDNRVIYSPNEPVEKPVFNTIEVPLGAEYNLQLSDGTKIHLNPDTQIRYPKTFYGDTREVWLSGEAYFEVTPLSLPFIVHSGNMRVNVLGTSFNVMAYNDYAIFETTLVAGSVGVQAGEDSGNAVVLSPSTQARVDLSDSNIEVRNVDTAKYLAWRDGLMIFDHETLGEISRTLSRWYKIEISIESDNLREITFYGKLPRYENIVTIFDMMNKIHKFKYETTDGKIVLKEI